MKSIKPEDKLEEVSSSSLVKETFKAKDCKAKVKGLEALDKEIEAEQSLDEESVELDKDLEALFQKFVDFNEKAMGEPLNPDDLKEDFLNIVTDKIWALGEDKIISEGTCNKPKGKKGVCCLCGARYYNYGNNPAPLMSIVSNNSKVQNRCCDNCNVNRVIPARLKQLKGGNENKI
jgi:hypothetical protein